MAEIGAIDSERYIKLPADEDISEDCGLSGEELCTLIYPCPENGGKPPVDHVKVHITGRKPVTVISWRSLRLYLMKQDSKNSYELPKSYTEFIREYDSSHMRDIPDSVELVTDIFTSDQIKQFDTFVKEQASMNRVPFIAYTRKGAAVGYYKKR